MAIRRGNTGSEVKEIQQLLGITVDGDLVLLLKKLL